MIACCKWAQFQQCNWREKETGTSSQERNVLPTSLQSECSKDMEVIIKQTNNNKKKPKTNNLGIDQSRSEMADQSQIFYRPHYCSMGVYTNRLHHIPLEFITRLCSTSLGDHICIYGKDVRGACKLAFINN